MRPATPRANGFEQLLLECLEPAVEQVFLRREVVEDRGGRDVGGSCHLRDRHGVEAAFREQRQRRVGNGGAHLLLLSLAESGSRHGTTVSARYVCLKIRCAINLE